MALRVHERDRSSARRVHQSAALLGRHQRADHVVAACVDCPVRRRARHSRLHAALRRDRGHGVRLLISAHFEMGTQCNITIAQDGHAFIELHVFLDPEGL